MTPRSAKSPRAPGASSSRSEYEAGHEDFLLYLTRAGTAALNRSQIATGTRRHRDTRFPPFAFTEQPSYKHHDDAIAAVLSAIRELMNPPAPKRRGIGFTADVSDPK